MCVPNKDPELPSPTLVLLIVARPRDRHVQAHDTPCLPSPRPSHSDGGFPHPRRTHAVYTPTSPTPR